MIHKTFLNCCRALTAITEHKKAHFAFSKPVNFTTFGVWPENISIVCKHGKQFKPPQRSASKIIMRQFSYQFSVIHSIKNLVDITKNCWNYVGRIQTCIHVIQEKTASCFPEPPSQPRWAFTDNIRCWVSYSSWKKLGSSSSSSWVLLLFFHKSFEDCC